VAADRAAQGNETSTAANDLLVVGAGVLGSLIGTNWLQQVILRFQSFTIIVRSESIKAAGNEEEEEEEEEVATTSVAMAFV
jgi:hypothetical protein